MSSYLLQNIELCCQLVEQRDKIPLFRHEKRKILSVPLCDFLPTVKLVDFEERGLDQSSM